jgi:hypothetical protein
MGGIVDSQQPDNRAAADDLISQIAVKTQRSVQEVRTCYEQERSALLAHARVRAFVPIFAARRTLEILDQQDKPK